MRPSWMFYACVDAAGISVCVGGGGWSDDALRLIHTKAWRSRWSFVWVSAAPPVNLLYSLIVEKSVHHAHGHL